MALALKFIKEHFDFVDAGTQDFNLETILFTIEQSKTICAKKFDMAIIDPWNELEAHRPAGMTETEAGTTE